MINNYLVIMAGGIGSRFWPMSTAETPKQFLDILGTGKTMIQQTVHRLKGIVPEENVFVVTSANYKQLVQEQLPSVPEDQVLLEPCMRNTAPCVAYASYKIKQKDPKANIVVAPSDHLITDETEYRKVIAEALAFTDANDALVTLGIAPHRPETGYGYIEIDNEQLTVDNGDCLLNKVKAFREKPDLETAQRYLESGTFFWNAGIFVWSADSIVKAFESYLPEMASLFASLGEVYGTVLEQSMIDEKFPTCENISIDYGIMENAQNIFVLPADFGWSDLGTWGSLWEKRNRDAEGNAIVGSEVHTFECKDTIVTVPDNRKVVLQGLEGYIVAEANGVFMVCKKEEEQRIKEFRQSTIDNE